MTGKKLVATGYKSSGMPRMKNPPAAVHVADTPEQLDVVDEYLHHLLFTRVRRHAFAGAEVRVIEDRGDRLKVSVGGLLGWVLKKELSEKDD